MGKTLYLDCSSGISGDMTVAALLDLGADEDRLVEALGTLPISGFDIVVSRVSKRGLDACDFDVRLDTEHENHDHDMEYLYGHLHGGREHAEGHGHAGHVHECHHDDHCHGHEHAHAHGHRSLAEIEAIIDASGLSARAKHTARSIFSKLAEAEARAHGAAPDTVLLHEVGAVDSIVDICAVAVCLDELNVEKVIVTELAEGHGTVRCAHGIMPIPVPAVANLCAMADIALAPSAVEGELVTPTGAAIVAALRTAGKLPARYRIDRIGVGAGKRAYEGCSGVLRTMLIDPVAAPMPPAPTNRAERAEVLKLEADIDDVTGEALARTIEMLMEAGAREAHAVPIVMKKGRPAYQLQVICDRAAMEGLMRIVYETTTTIGMRFVSMECDRLEREAGYVDTPYGTVAAKRVVLPGGATRMYPEYDSVVEVSGCTGVPFQDVFRAAQGAEYHAGLPE